MSSIFFSNCFYDYISLITSFFLSPFKNNCAFIGGTCCSPYLFPCPFSFSISFLLLFLLFAFPCKFACLQANFTRIRQTTNSPKWVQYCPRVVLVVAPPVAAIIAMLAIVKCGRRCWCRMLGNPRNSVGCLNLLSGQPSWPVLHVLRVSFQFNHAITWGWVLHACLEGKRGMEKGKREFSRFLIELMLARDTGKRM